MLYSVIIIIFYLISVRPELQETRGHLGWRPGEHDVSQEISRDRRPLLRSRNQPDHRPGGPCRELPAETPQRLQPSLAQTRLLSVESFISMIFYIFTVAPCVPRDPGWEQCNSTPSSRSEQSSQSWEYF